MLQFDLSWALFLLPLPILVYWLSPEFRDSGEALRAPFFNRLVRLTGSRPTTGAMVELKRWPQKINAIATWALVVFALARPVWVDDPIVQEISARDMLLIVDLSGSMQETDFTDNSGEYISRLAAVKDVLANFINKRGGDRIGLAVFGNAAFPQAPFTDDHKTVLALLEETQVNMAGPKTMIGDAIGLAIRLFESSSISNKVAILLTDGNDSGSKMPITQAASIAADKDITIHTIAMGDPANSGENELDTDALKEISSTTGGNYFLALDRASLDGVYAELDKLEPQKLDTISYRPKIQLFHYPLAGLLIINLLLIIGMSAIRLQREHSND